MSDDLYRFEGGPIDAPADASEAFQAIGHLAASWSRLEQHIDVLLVHINKGAFSTTLYDPDHPVSFKRKLALLKRWFNRHPTLKPYADNMRVLTSILSQLAEGRNTYLHSALESYDPASRTVVFHSVKYLGKDTFQFSRQAIPLDGIVATTTTVNSGNRFLWSMTSEIFTEDALKRLQKL